MKGVNDLLILSISSLLERFRVMQHRIDSLVSFSMLCLYALQKAFLMVLTATGKRHGRMGLWVRLGVGLLRGGALRYVYITYV